MTGPEQDDRAAGMPSLGGHPGPVLVIADNGAVARRAPAWAAWFSSLGRRHRVRLVGRAAGDTDGLVAEAMDLAASAVLAAGGAEARRAGRAVAMQLGLPLAIEHDRTPADP